MNGRYRHLRQTEAVRALVRETVLGRDDLVQPFFVIEGTGQTQEVASMPGVARYSLDRLLPQVEAYLKAGGKAGLFFGLPDHKDARASQAYAPDGIVQRAVRVLKKEFPGFLVITDVCLCAYTDHGHCGVVFDGEVDNDQTLPLLSRTAVSHAEAGADWVAPSDMMDLRVAEIRRALDRKGLTGTAILSYAAKYASAFYGPFRDAARSQPGFGDRKSYQMDPANRREALKEARQDVAEGADMVMVKPASVYLDIVRTLRDHLDVPVAAYHVSGEYAMIKAAAEKGWLDEKQAVLETLTAVKRAGAGLILTYYAKQAMEWINAQR